MRKLWWGHQSTAETSTGSRSIDLFQWTGTKDPAAALTVRSAIRFMQEHHWPDVRLECHELLRHTLRRIGDLTGLPPLYELDLSFYSQMGVALKSLLPPVAPWSFDRSCGHFSKKDAKTAPHLIRIT